MRVKPLLAAVLIVGGLPFVSPTQATAAAHDGAPKAITRRSATCYAVSYGITDTSSGGDEVGRIKVVCRGHVWVKMNVNHGSDSPCYQLEGSSPDGARYTIKYHVKTGFNFGYGYAAVWQYCGASGTALVGTNGGGSW